ncbi:MAG: DUF1615 family protein [Alphaproteobacteria bacterium]|nr:DUF1615 family protein [Alphaproteobacteria bacterium]
MKRLMVAVVAFALGPGITQAQNAELSISQTSKLISKARPGVADAQGWAIDLLDVLRAQGLAPSRENVCSAIAIIAQESGFVADPAVAGLGALAEKALRAKFERIPLLGRMAIRFLETTPSEGDSYLARIRAAKTERDLDMTYRAMVEDAGKRSSMSMLVQSGLLNQVIEDRNDINTIGSMQVSVRFALRNAKARRWLPMTLADVYAVRDDLYTRHGGLYYGVMQLLGYDSGYNRKIYRFADYNAGRYASRNAAFQKIISVLSKLPLASDGDLLLYNKDEQALAKMSGTEQALRSVIAKYNLGIDHQKLRADLLKEKSADFPATQTYLQVRDVYARSAKGVVAFAAIPEIELSSPKIRHYMTTRIFADRVDKRYQACIALKL